MEKIIIKGKDAREGLAKGIELLYEAVGSTLGPCGNTVVIEDQFGGSPVITKDGVTVARNTVLKDQIENLGVNIVKQVAAKTEELVGDGTTTATVLAWNIYSEAIKHINNNSDLHRVRESLKALKDSVIKYIDADTVKDVSESDMFNIAMISSNGDEEISNIIKDAFVAVGKNGTVAVDSSNTVKTELRVSNGTEIDAGYISPYFVTDASSGECILKDCLVFLSSSPIVASYEITPIMQAAFSVKRPLLIVAPNVVGDALATLVTNKTKGIINACAVKISQFRNMLELLEDLSKITGSQVFPTNGTNLSDIKSLDGIATVGKVVVTSKTTTITNSSVPKEDIDSYIDYLNEKVRPNLKAYEVPAFNLRIGRLAAGVANIYVGGLTEAEQKERRDRVDDAVYAVKAAIDGGTVNGGGRELYNISNILEGPDEVAVEILRNALKAPFRLMIKNAELDCEEIEKQFHSIDEGIDLRKKKIGDLRQMGILDPAKVTKLAFKNAMSIVEILLSTNVVLLNVNPKKTPLSDKIYDL